jgi:hypothetical protein
MKQTRLLLLVLSLPLLFGACRSSRHAAKSGIPAAETRSAVTTVKAVAAKMNLRLETGSKSVDVGGSLRLKRDEVIQLNLTYTLIVTVNVGTMEITPDYILILDRLNKRYCRVSYSDVPQLAKAGIDFPYLQCVFWGEAGESPRKELVEWAYDNWMVLGDGQFPGQTTFTVKAGSVPYRAVISLSNIRENDSWETHTEVSSKYTPVPLSTVMNALMSVAK